MTEELRFDIAGLAQLCVLLISAFIAINLVYAGNSIAFFRVIEGIDAGTIGYAEVTNFEDRSRVLAITYNTVFLISAVLSSIWIYRASWNARQIQPIAARISPGWAVGWALVPIMNLWKPYVAIKQIWNSSHVPNGNLTSSPPEFTTYWWGAWLLGSLLNRLAAFIFSLEPSTKEFRAGNTIDLAATLMLAVAAFLFIRIIRNITEAQRDKSSAMKEEIAP